MRLPKQHLWYSCSMFPARKDRSALEQRWECKWIDSFLEWRRFYGRVEIDFNANWTDWLRMPRGSFFESPASLDTSNPPLRFAKIQSETLRQPGSPKPSIQRPSMNCMLIPSVSVAKKSGCLTNEARHGTAWHSTGTAPGLGKQSCLGDESRHTRSEP